MLLTVSKTFVQNLIEKGVSPERVFHTEYIRPFASSIKGFIKSKVLLNVGNSYEILIRGR